MLHRCLCGRYTDLGAFCMACSMSRNSEDVEEIDIEDYLEQVNFYLTRTC